MTDLKFFFKRILIGVTKLFKGNGEWLYLPLGNKSFDQLRSDHPVLYHNTVKGYWRKPPVTVGKIHKKFKKNLNEPPQETYVIQGQNWYVWGNQGAVVTADHYLFAGASREFDNRIHSIFNQFKLAEVTPVAGCSALLAASGSFVYYHWMFDILPRLGLLEQSGALSSIDKFITNYLPNNYQAETLAKAGIDNAKIIASNDHWDFHIKAEKLLVPSMVSPNDRPSLAACNYLRELYSQQFEDNGLPVNIYIQRLEGRKIINEDELLAYLAPFDFKVVRPEELSVAEQANLFSRARVVIGAHGAGFTNIVFCKPGTVVIDLFSAEWVNPCYWIIAEHLQLKYGYLQGEPIAQAQKGKRADVIVNMNKLKTLFDKLNIQHGE